MLRLLEAAGQGDLVLALISGGGSALLAAPMEGMSVDDKARLATALMAQGADIQILNQIRRELSQVKAGGLARVGSAEWNVGLILSDIVGNPIELVASGPTVVPATSATARAAEALRAVGSSGHPAPGADSIYNVLQQKKDGELVQAERLPGAGFKNFLIGDLETAVRGAAEAAAVSGWATEFEWASEPEGDVGLVRDRVLHQLDRLAARVDRTGKKVCWVSGGEPTVGLCDRPGRGGRNQQLVLEVIQSLLAPGESRAGMAAKDLNFLRRRVRNNDLKFCFLSAGSDGEDGNSPNAGGWLDERVLVESALRGDLDHCVLNNDASSFLEHVLAVLPARQTNTNVGDLRVMLVGHPSASDGSWLA